MCTLVIQTKKYGHIYANMLIWELDTSLIVNITQVFEKWRVTLIVWKYNKIKHCCTITNNKHFEEGKWSNYWVYLISKICAGSTNIKMIFITNKYKYECEDLCVSDECSICEYDVMNGTPS